MMNKRWIGSSFLVGALLLAAPGILAAREPKVPDPCKQLKNDLDNQVNGLHRRQDDELAQCRQANGKNAQVCRDLKTQQQLSLRQLRDQRQAELDSCNPRLSRGPTEPRLNNSCDSESYRHHQNDCYSKEKYPEPPYKHPPKYPPPKDPPVAHDPPPKHPDNGGGRHRDNDAGDTRNAGNSGSSHHGSDHGSGSSSSSSNGGSGSSTSSHSSSGS
jgi:uncharacterized membrane protein YgcG